MAYKKFYRKADEHLNGQIEAKHGKQANQKLKAYLVMQYLLRRTDENHAESAYDIIDFLAECGISAERRSIYRDVEDINKVSWLMENLNSDGDITIQDAEEALAADEDNLEKLVVYDKSMKGFYVRQRHFDLNDIRLLAECVYSAKFISQGQADRLADVVCEFVSEHQAKKIRHDAFLTDRVKTHNKAVLNSISTINDAMSKELDGLSHEPEKISFQYLKYSIDDLSQQAERRHGARYTVSPFKLLINDGNYYLLAFDDYSQDMRTYRVDRMKDVRRTKKPRDGADAFFQIDLRTYTKRVFSMFGGERKTVSIRFINPLLDAVVDRFGTKDANYSRSDDGHFTVTAEVEISDQFFGWLLGFGNKAKLTAPESVVKEFIVYLDKIRGSY